MVSWFTPICSLSSCFPRCLPPDYSTPGFDTTTSYGHPFNPNSTQCGETATDLWEWVYTWQPPYILLITALGIVLNVFVLAIFLLHKKASTVAEIYLSNLAVADLVLMCCLPFWAVNIINEFNWPFGQFLCKAVNLGVKLNFYSSIYLLVLVSIDRYVALVHTMSYGQMRRPKHAKLGCLMMWGFGLLLSIPDLIYRRVKHIPKYEVHACTLDYGDQTVELVCDGLMVVFSFMIPFLIISLSVVKIIQALSVKAVERINAERTERRATTLMLVVLLAFLICWVPFHVTTALDMLSRAGVITWCHFSNVVEICNQLFTYLALFNSVLNPVLYVIVGKNFRKKVREVFQQWCKKKQKPPFSESMHSHLSTLKTLV